MAKIPRTESERKDALVAQNIAEGMTQKQAVIAAGYSESTAQSRSSIIVERALRNSPMIDALERANVTRDLLAKKIKRGLNAKKVQRILVGATVAEYVDIDHQTRLGYLKTALQVRGEDSPPKQITEETETFEQRIRRLRGAAAMSHQLSSKNLIES